MENHRERRENGSTGDSVLRLVAGIVAVLLLLAVDELLLLFKLLLGLLLFVVMLVDVLLLVLLRHLSKDKCCLALLKVRRSWLLRGVDDEILRSLSSSSSEDNSRSDATPSEHQLSSELIVRAEGVCSSLRRLFVLLPRAVPVVDATVVLNCLLPLKLLLCRLTFKQVVVRGVLLVVPL